MDALSNAFDEGGWGMWPILICAVLTIAIALERAVFLIQATIDKDKLLNLMKSEILSGNVQGAIKVCSGNPSPMTRIVAAGLSSFNRSDEEIQAAMDEAALRELPKVEKRTPYIGTLANLAVLAGLLGTVTGMIKSFGGAANAAPSEKAKILASGISEAMNCTAFGIGTALFGLVCFALLMGKTQSINDDINEVSVQIVNLVTSHKSALKSQAA